MKDTDQSKLITLFMEQLIESTEHIKFPLPVVNLTELVHTVRLPESGSLRPIPIHIVNLAVEFPLESLYKLHFVQVYHSFFEPHLLGMVQKLEQIGTKLVSFSNIEPGSGYYESREVANRHLDVKYSVSPPHWEARYNLIMRVGALA